MAYFELCDLTQPMLMTHVNFIFNGIHCTLALLGLPADLQWSVLWKVEVSNEQNTTMAASFTVAPDCSLNPDVVK